MELKRCGLCGGEPEVVQKTLVHGHLVGTYIEIGCPGKCAFVQVRVKGSTVKDIEDTKREAIRRWNLNGF